MATTKDRIETWDEFRSAWKQCPFLEWRLGMLKGFPRPEHIDLGMKEARFTFYTSIAMQNLKRIPVDGTMKSIEAQVCLAALLHSLELAPTVDSATALLNVLSYDPLGLSYFLARTEPYSKKVRSALSAIRNKAGFRKYRQHDGWEENRVVPSKAWYRAAIVTGNAELIRNCFPSDAYAAVKEYISTCPGDDIEKRIDFVRQNNITAWQVYIHLRIATGNFGDF